MMTLARARLALDATLAAARAVPVAAIVLDAGGHTVAFARQDGASLFRHDIARAKALGAIGMGQDSAEIAERAQANPAFFTSVAVATGGALALSAGGVLIRDADGAILGAIGVSGDTPDIDAACARAGVAAFHGDR